MREVALQKRSRVSRWAAVGIVGVTVLAGCEDILDVDLPTAVTEAALDNPATAATQVNSIMAAFECSYSAFVLRAAGMEDNFQRYSGVAGTYSEYDSTPAGGACDSGAAYSSPWLDPLLTARGTGYATYARLNGWTDAQVPQRRRLLAQAALYTALTLDVFGEHFCEFAVDAGPLMTYSQTLDLAEAWADSAIAHITATGDFAISTTRGTITSSIRQMAFGLRSRIRWAKGDLAGAASDAAQVANNFVAVVLREEGEDRRNTTAVFQGGAGQAAGFLQGPVVIKTGTVPYGITELGNNPVTGQPWPSPVPFTGYLNLAIDPATGRTVTDAGYPITMATAGAVRDTRVLHRIGNTAGGPDNIVNKYTAATDDIPLINWREMRLIQAEAQNASNNTAAAIGFINQLRTAANLPTLQGTYTQEQLRRLIIEERRRALWLEGRFWATKILNPDLLWFPRQRGQWINSTSPYTLGGGVRVLMPNSEYQINRNLDLSMRGTGCPAPQAPVFGG